jgi:preprotein translocase subunit YajC
MSISFLLPLVLLFIVLWMFLIRPQRQRGQKQVAMQDQLRTGDEIVTAGGLHATVVSIEGDVLEIELAPSTVARLDRRAVAAIAPRDEPEEEPEPEREPEEVAEEPVSSDDG